MAASPTERVGVSWNLHDVTVMWQFNVHSDGNLDVVASNGTANIPLSNGSNIMYFCSVFVKIWFCKIL
jgi:hypothetical protein